jgi:hypothetical protein
MSNVLSTDKKQQVIALGKLGWSLRRIEEVTGVRRETASTYLKAAGVAVCLPGWGRRAPAKPAMQVTPDFFAPFSQKQAHAAARKKGSYFQAVFRRLLPRLGYKSAIWAIAHRLCRVVWKILHERIRFIEQGMECDPKLQKHRARYLARALRKLGYNVQITPTNPSVA